jgi:hypothetical protein
MSAGPSTLNQSAVLADPGKHVNYTLGMILGVDDFVQEFVYLSGRDQAFARDLTGYGTVSGLQIAIETDARGSRVVVSPGIALSVQGQMIRVREPQCAYLADWVTDNRRAIVERLGSPPDDTVTVYVVLGYRDCPVDPVPLPGEPCRAEDDMMAPSRLVDDFRLELRFDPPDQSEEDALRGFARWLAQVSVVDSGAVSSVADLVAAIRVAADAGGSPPETLDFSNRPPPASLKIPSANRPAYLQAAFRTWATELRPRLTRGAGGARLVPDELSVLLCEIAVPVQLDVQSDNWVLDRDRSIGVLEDRRPYVIHHRLAQEWLLQSGAGAALPRDLTRVVGLSWKHNAVSVTRTNLATVKRLNPTSPLQTGFVVAFGLKLTNSPANLRKVRFGSGSIDESTFELYFIESFTAGNPPSEFYARVPRIVATKPFSELIPVDIQRIDATGLVTAANELATTPTGVLANGAAIVVDPSFFDLFKQRQVFVQLRTGFMADSTKRAVDGNFALATLPTGDQIQGGDFLSWVRLQ